MLYVFFYIPEPIIWKWWQSFINNAYLRAVQQVPIHCNVFHWTAGGCFATQTVMAHHIGEAHGLLKDVPWNSQEVGPNTHKLDGNTWESVKQETQWHFFLTRGQSLPAPWLGRKWKDTEWPWQPLWVGPGIRWIGSRATPPEIRGRKLSFPLVKIYFRLSSDLIYIFAG